MDDLPNFTARGQFGTIFYLLDDKGTTYVIPYEVWQAIGDLDNGVITDDQLEERIAYHYRQSEIIDCPFCDKKMKRSVVEMLSASYDERAKEFHDVLAHW